MAEILFIGKGRTKEERFRKLRCAGCEYLHENGNCLKVGGFYSSVADKYCPKITQNLKEVDI